MKGCLSNELEFWGNNLLWGRRAFSIEPTPLPLNRSLGMWQQKYDGQFWISPLRVFFLLDTQIAVSYYIASAPREQTHKATFFSISSGRTTMTIHTTFNINRKTLSLSVRIRCTTFLTEGKSHWYYSATHRAYKSFILFHTQTLTRIHRLSLASHQTNCP